MKTGVIGIIIVVLLIGGMIIYTQSNKEAPVKGTSLEVTDETSPNTNNIEIKSFSFLPETLTIKKGETLTWTNKDSAPHTVTSISGSELNSPSLSKDQTYSHTFNTLGTFEYRCNFHTSMKGKIIVTE